MGSTLVKIRLNIEGFPEKLCSAGCLAALAALAVVGAASAQSTVTISGGMVLGVGSTKFGTANSGMQILRQTGNLQFAGTEDLGGGLRAGFQVQTTLGTRATSNRATGATDGGYTWLGDRASNLTLSGGFGRIAVGRDSTAIRGLFGAIGDVSRLPVATGLSDSAAVNSNALTAVTSSDQAARIIYGDTFANGVAYTTPNMNGFSATVGTAFAQTVTTGVGNDTANKDTFSYTAQYSQGPINAAYNLTDAKASGGGASNGAYKIHTALVSYDFGVAKVGLTHQSIKLEIGTSPGDAMALTANIPMGAGSIGVQYGKRSDKAVADTRFNDNAKQLAVGYRYDLSKRTAVSLVYNKLDRATSANDIKETHVMIGHTF